MMTFEFPAQSIHVPDEIFHLLVLQPSGIADGAHDVRGLKVQLSPGLREVDTNLALIGRITTSLDIAERFQPFQHRRKGVRLQEITEKRLKKLKLPTNTVIATRLGTVREVVHKHAYSSDAGQAFTVGDESEV